MIPSICSGFWKQLLLILYLKTLPGMPFGIFRDSLYLALYPTGIGLRIWVPPHGQFGGDFDLIVR